MCPADTSHSSEQPQTLFLSASVLWGPHPLGDALLLPHGAAQVPPSCQVPPPLRPLLSLTQPCCLPRCPSTHTAHLSLPFPPALHCGSDSSRPLSASVYPRGNLFPCEVQACRPGPGVLRQRLPALFSVNAPEIHNDGRRAAEEVLSSSLSLHSPHSGEA